MRAPIHTDSRDMTNEHKDLNINDPDLRLCVCSSFTGDLCHQLCSDMNTGTQFYTPPTKLCVSLSADDLNEAD